MSCEYVSLFRNNWASYECGSFTYLHYEEILAHIKPPPHNLVSLTTETNDTLKPATFRA